MKKIAITGPESSGKTTLAKALAEWYKISVVEEFSRIYLQETNGAYEQSDLIHIAHGQLNSVESRKHEAILISDTDFIVIGVWSDYKYGVIAPEVQALIDANHFDLHILCEPDIPWEPDELREHPEERYTLFEHYKSLLNSNSKRYVVVNGTVEKRMKKAIEAIGLL